MQFGEVSTATVNFYCIEPDGDISPTSLGSTTTDANCMFSVSVSNRNCSMIAITSGGQYADEATGAVVNIPENQQIRALPATSCVYAFETLNEQIIFLKSTSSFHSRLLK